MEREPARFWVYAREHVVGPYDADEVPRLPVFGPDLPLCPEALLGTTEERWTRAADTEGLGALFPPSQRTPAGAEPPKVGPWPPDPSREAVDLLGTAQGRMDIIDQSLAATQRRFELRRAAYEALRRELAARIAQAGELESKVRDMGARMGGFIGMKGEVDQARAALAMQTKRVEDLEARLTAMGDELKVAAEAAAAAEAQRPPRARRGRTPASAPSAPAPKPRRRPSAGGTPDLGLPPATRVDVPDFS